MRPEESHGFGRGAVFSDPLCGFEAVKNKT